MMNLIEPVAAIRAAIEESAVAESDVAWQSAVQSAGLQPQSNTSPTGIDQEYIRSFGPIELRVRYTWRDTSKTFKPGPDRTRITLDVRHNGAILDSHTNGYDK